MQLVDRVVEHVGQHGQPVTHPSGRPGQVDHQRLPGHPGNPSGEHGRGHLRQAGSAHRVGQPGDFVVEYGPGGLGSPVRGRHTGAPGGDHHVHALRHRMAHRVGHRVAVGNDGGLVGPVAPLAQPRDDQRPAPVLVHSGGRAVRCGHHPRAALFHRHSVTFRSLSAPPGGSRCRSCRRPCARPAPRRARPPGPPP